MSASGGQMRFYPPHAAGEGAWRPRHAAECVGCHCWLVQQCDSRSTDKPHCWASQQWHPTCRMGWRKLYGKPRICGHQVSARIWASDLPITGIQIQIAIRHNSPRSVATLTRIVSGE